MRITRLAIVLVLGSTLATLAADPGKPAPLPLPPVEIRARGGEYGPEKWTWDGVAVVVDPVNKETLYLGGRCGGVESGSLGNWALSEDGKTWRRLAGKSKVLDPLRAKCLAVRQLVRDAESAARNIFYSATEPDQRAKAVRNGPTKTLDQADTQTAQLASDLAPKEMIITQESPAKAQAAARILNADDSIYQTWLGFGLGQLNAAWLKICFDAQWTLDEAADCLASSPGPRVGAFAAYDPQNKCVVLFGGSHGDYVMNDTWIYDCATKTWRQTWPKVAPSPRAAAAEPMATPKAPSTQPAMRYDAATGKLILTGGVTLLNKMVYQEGFSPMPADEWTFDAKTGEWSAKGDAAQAGAKPCTRIYRTIVPAYDPTWYDAAPRGDAAATGEWLKNLKPNAWTKVPTPDRPGAEREWGTARFDPDRDQMYRWSGGHQADPSNVVTTYHPGINRYSIGYVAEIYGKGISFSGRPDCLNHTYLHCAYDPVSKCLVCTSMGGTGVYNPDRGDWDYTVAQPFNHHIYETCTVGTPRGVVVWTPGYFGLLDVKAREWKKLPVAGPTKLPRSMTDGSGLAYDAKRDCIWFASHDDYQKPSGQMWQYDMKTGLVKAMDPGGKSALVGNKGFMEIRETVWLPKLDLVLFNNFVTGGEVAYDPTRNRWVRLDIARNQERLGTVSDTLMYDPKRDLVWNWNAYKLMYVLKLDPATLAISDLAESATSAPAGPH